MLELLLATLSSGLGDHRVDVIGEELEGPLLAVLLAHEQQRNLRREEQRRRTDAELLRSRTVAEGAVADLIVILRANDEAVRGAALELTTEIRDRTPVVGVVPVLLAGQEHVQRVMKLVGPLRVVSPLTDGPLVARLDFRDHEHTRVDRAHPLGQLREDVRVAVVVDRVHGVQPEPVDVIVANPHLRVLNRPFTDPATAVVERLSPEGRLAVGEVPPERRDGLRARADVVVDDVENDTEARAVRNIDQARESLGPAVDRVRCKGVHAVVSPVAPTGESCDRHQLDRRHAELTQIVQAFGNTLERPARRERADVELVDDELLTPETRPLVLGPPERARVDDLRRPTDPLRLRAGARIGPDPLTVEHEQVVATYLRVDLRTEEPVVAGTEVMIPVVSPHGDRRGLRRPDRELDLPTAARHGAEKRPGVHVRGGYPPTRRRKRVRLRDA